MQIKRFRQVLEGYVDLEILEQELQDKGKT
jgi:hypothetical protein